MIFDVFVAIGGFISRHNPSLPLCTVMAIGVAYLLAYVHPDFDIVWHHQKHHECNVSKYLYKLKRFVEVDFDGLSLALHIFDTV